MSISLAATWGAILLGIFSCAAVAPSFASSDQLTRASATKKAEPTPYWAAPNGLSYDLRSIFHEVLRFRVRGDPRRRVEVTLGGSLPCTPRTNPRRVAACVHDVDGHAAVLGLKADFRFEEMENPEGFRLWYEHKAHSFTLDFFCSDAEFPTNLDYLDRIADPEITGFAASYFGRITSVVGCGFVLPDPSGHPHKDDGPALTWRAHGGGQGFRFSSQTVLEGQLLVELEPPHGLDAIEISLGSPTPCTGVDTETVAICFYPHAEPPVAAGYHSSLQLRRAHHGGVDIHVQGGRCSPTRNYRTHIVVKCQGLGEASSLWAWRSTNGGCDLIIEMVSPFGCGVETHAKPPARHAPRLSIATNHHNEVGDGTAHEDNVAFQPDVNSFGCIEGNCKTGTGTYKWRTGSTYIGEWKDGARHGQGLHEWPDGRRYSGEWNDNVRCGQGTHRFANRDKYTGTVFLQITSTQTLTRSLDGRELGSRQEAWRRLVRVVKWRLLQWNFYGRSSVRRRRT